MTSAPADHTHALPAAAAPAPLQDATLVARSPDQLCTELDGEFVVMHTGTGKYYTLSDTTHAIWRHLEAPTRLDALVRALLAEYEVDEAVCRAETAAFLRELATAGLARLDA